MSYSTNTTIAQLLPVLPQSAGASGYTRTQSLVESHITRADSLINSKVANRYDVSSYDTAGSVPPLLRTLSEDIAAYYSYRSLYSADGQNDNEWTDKFKDAIEILNEIRQGDMDLVDTAGAMLPIRASSTVDDIASNTEDYTPTFGEDSSLDWAVDSTKINNLSDDRS